MLIIRRAKFYLYIIWYNTLWWVTDVPVRHVRQSLTRVCYTR
jgi:hypothetical protein